MQATRVLMATACAIAITLGGGGPADAARVSGPEIRLSGGNDIRGPGLPTVVVQVCETYYITEAEVSALRSNNPGKSDDEITAFTNNYYAMDQDPAAYAPDDTIGQVMKQLSLAQLLAGTHENGEYSLEQCGNFPLNMKHTDQDHAHPDSDSDDSGPDEEWLELYPKKIWTFAEGASAAEVGDPQPADKVRVK